MLLGSCCKCCIRCGVKPTHSAHLPNCIGLTRPQPPLFNRRRTFHGHRNFLCTSSTVFEALLDKDFTECAADTIEVPHARWEVFHVVMVHVYTGLIEVPDNLAAEVLVAADYY